MKLILLDIRLDNSDRVRDFIINSFILQFTVINFALINISLKKKGLNYNNNSVSYPVGLLTFKVNFDVKYD